MANPVRNISTNGMNGCILRSINWYIILQITTTAHLIIFLLSDLSQIIPESYQKTSPNLWYSMLLYRFDYRRSLPAVLSITENITAGKSQFKKRKTLFPDWISVCVSQQLRRLSALSLLHCALVRVVQHLSLTALSSTFGHKHLGITLAGGASFP